MSGQGLKRLGHGTFTNNGQLCSIVFMLCWVKHVFSGLAAGRSELNDRIYDQSIINTVKTKICCFSHRFFLSTLRCN